MFGESIKRYIVEAPPEVTPQIAQSRLQEINVLLRTILTPNLGLGSDMALHTLLDLARQIRDFDGAIIYAIHPEDQKLINAQVKGFEHLKELPTGIAEGNLFLDWTMTQAKSFLVPSPEGAPEKIRQQIFPFRPLFPQRPPGWHVAIVQHTIGVFPP